MGTVDTEKYSEINMHFRMPSLRRGHPRIARVGPGLYARATIPVPLLLN